MAQSFPNNSMMAFSRPGTNDPAYLRKQALSAALMKDATAPRPAYSWGEALARALEGGVVGIGSAMEDKSAQARDKKFQEDFGAATSKADPQKLADALAGSGNADVQAMVPWQRMQDASTAREAALKAEDRNWRTAESDKDRTWQEQKFREQMDFQRQIEARRAATANPVSFGSPVEVMGPDGKTILVQFNNRGGYRAVEGLSLPQAQPGGPYAGNSTEAAARNLVLKGQNDPAIRATPEYADAWTKVYGPKRVYNEQLGQEVTIRPEVPQGFVPPGSAAPAQAPVDPQQAVIHPPSGQPPQVAQMPQPQQSAPPASGTPNVQIQNVSPRPPSAGDLSKVKAIEMEADTLLSSLGEFRNLVKTTPTADFLSAAGPVPTAAGARLNTAWTNSALMAKAEALFNLGVLNGPDLQILEKTLSNPSTLRGAITSRDAYEAQIDQIEKLIRARVAAARNRFGGVQTFPGSAPGENPPPHPQKRMRYNVETGVLE